MELGIKGHKTRGDEVVKILETLGGKNHYKLKLTGDDENHFYYITNHYKDINNSHIGPDEIKGYEIFSLEDFLKKFPYKVGDKVKVWINYDHFGGHCAELEVAEIKSMRWNSARSEIAYRLKDINGEFYKDVITGKVDEDEEQQIDPSIDYYKVVENELYEDIEKRKIEITMDTLFRAGITLEHLKECGCELPDGYHFTDENGNVIDTTKILLVKNAPSYPKTYEECCDVIGISRHEVEIDVPRPYQQNMFNLFKLLICRDAYWKIAGEELGLDKPWKPVWDESEDLYTIHTFNGEIRLSGTAHRNAILVFPIEEMRDMFYENFKELIEQCKELL